MIEAAHGNLINAQVEALVNTVNTVGVMGKGIALQFKKAYPANFTAYASAARHEQIVIGKMFVYEIGAFTLPRYIINFPTKRHWRAKARLEDIELGLEDLVRVLRDRRIQSVAIPPLGCGYGGLDWREVRPLIEKALSVVPDVRVMLYAPEGTPAPEAMPVGTMRPTLTPGRAAVICLMDQYQKMADDISLLTIQKLAYFLQAAGEPLRLQYGRRLYGPYAENLNFVLQQLDGHYLNGYGDRTNVTNLYLVPGVDREAEEYLQHHQDTSKRVELVMKLIEGFETPWGLELLATIHWLAWNDKPEVKTDIEEAVQGVAQWSDRKRDHFRPEHVRIAWRRLREQGWLNEEPIPPGNPQLSRYPGIQSICP